MSYEYQQPSHLTNPYNVGLNRLGRGTGRGSITMQLQRTFNFYSVLFQPFVNREQGMEMKNGNPSYWLGIKKTAISVFLELGASFLLTLIVVGTVAGAFAAGANIVLIGLLAGFVHALGRYASVAARYTPHLPRHLDPGFTWYEICHGNLGVVIGVFYMLAQYGGASLAMLLLCHPALHVSDTWAGPGKFGGSTTDLSCFALWAYYTSALVIIYFVHGFGQTFTSTRFSYAKRYVQVAGLQAATIFVLTQLYIHLGIFSLNPLIFYTGAVGGGTQTAITGSWLDWAIIILWAPLTAGVVAAFFVWLLWNVNAMSEENMRKGMAVDELDGDGGAAHTPTGRHEVMPDPGPATVTQHVQEQVAARHYQHQQQHINRATAPGMVDWLYQHEKAKEN